MTSALTEASARVAAAWPRQRIDDELAILLGRRLGELRFLGAETAPFKDVLGRLVCGPGKRLRPCFVYWGYRAAGGSDAEPAAQAAVRVGCAVEFLHACALICDDLIDGSAMRRWEPAAHVRLADEHASRGWRGSAAEFGRGAALILGLQAFAWADAAIGDAGLPPARLAEVMRVFTTLRTEVIGGQYLDLVSAQRQDSRWAIAERVAEYKTARYTVERPLQLGAAVAGRAPDGFLPGYGVPLGKAFQFRDDILGAFGDPAVTGKPAGEDIREGKQTVLLLTALRLASPAERHVIGSVTGKPDATQADVADVREILQRCGALAEVERRIRALAGEARSAVTAAPGIPAQARAALLTLAGQATKRGW